MKNLVGLGLTLCLAFGHIGVYHYSPSTKGNVTRTFAKFLYHVQVHNTCEQWSIMQGHGQ